MKRLALVCLVLFCYGCQSDTSVPANAEASVEPLDTVEVGTSDALTNQVWVRSDSTQVPGTMQVFLEGDVLISDSCWETYRLSQWERMSDSTLRWQEDGMTINATILSVDEASLTLRLDLIGGSVEQHFTKATVAYVCPDMPR